MERSAGDGHHEPLSEPGANAGLESFPTSAVAVVFGANGGIWGALVEALRGAGDFEHVCSRSAAAHLRHSTYWTRPVWRAPRHSPP